MEAGLLRNIATRIHRMVKLIDSHMQRPTLGTSPTTRRLPVGVGD
jgi:hypothetical protein